MTEQNLPELPPGMMPLFAGYPEYEQVLARDCPHIGKPCIREQCKKWVTVTLKLQNKLAPTVTVDHLLYQCMDDGVFTALMGLNNSFAQMMMAGQQMQMARMRRSAMGEGGGLPFGTPMG